MGTSADTQNELAQTSIRRLLFRLAVPAITAQIINALYNIIDRVYIGHIPGDGALALTGLGICMPLIMAVTAFASLVGMGGAPRASMEMGRQNYARAEQILGNCVTVLLIISAVLTILILLFCEPLLYAFGASPQTIGYAQDYMSVYILGTVFIQITTGLNSFISAQGFARISMITILTGAVFNIMLDPLFIYTFQMGARGAALATIISQGISAVWVLRFLLGKRTSLKIRRQYLRPAANIVLPCLGLGLSPFVMQITESIITICFNSSLLSYGGDIAVGTMTILSTVIQFSFLPLNGLTQGAQPILSYNYGAGNMERVRKTFRLLLVVCLSYSLALWIVTEFFPWILVSIFTKDPVYVDTASRSLPIFMFGMGIFGIQIACQQTFVALGQAKISLFLATLRKVLLLIPFIYIFPLFFSDPVTGVLFAEPVADILAVCTTSVLFYIKSRTLFADRA